MTLGFVIPFKPKFTTKSWETDNELLCETINSITNQTYPDIKVYIVFSDEPLKFVSDKRVKFLKFGYPYLKFKDIPNNENELIFHKDKMLLEKRLDKSKKIMWGCKMAKEDGCDYIMAIDADDLISNKIAEYVNLNHDKKKVPGWFISKGIVLKYKSRIGIGNDYMNLFNGSTHIIRQDLIKIPDFETAYYLDYSLFTSHGWTVSRMEDVFKQKLKEIKFYAVIYVVHSNNTSSILKLHTYFSVRNFVKRIVRFKYIGTGVKKEFSINW